MHIAYFQAEERTKKMSTKDQRGVEEQASQRNHQVVFAAMTCEEGLNVEGGWLQPREYECTCRSAADPDSQERLPASHTL